ncbi:MAG: hypothetical protein LBF74_02490, partial [Treponema sp.]|nr:hypothetical protein [Treponema sp.]
PAEWATGYRIYRYSTAGGRWEIIASRLSVGTISYIDDGISSGTYDYRIMGLVGSAGSPLEGPGYSVQGATTGLLVPPNVRASTAASRGSPFQTSVTWGAVSGADYYRVYRNGSYLTSISSTSYDDTSLKSVGGSYSYTIAAYSYYWGEEGGQSASSSASTVGFTVTGNLVLNTPNAGTINTSGEFDCYHFSVPSSGYYEVRLEDGSSGYSSFDAYLYVYQDGNLITSLDSGSQGVTLTAGDVLYVIPVPYSVGSTGGYRVTIEKP